MPRLAPYLQRRGSGFTFRISVPPELRQLIGAREFTKALSETNYEAASPTALEFAAAAKRLFFEVREMKTMGALSQEQIKAAIGKGKESLKLSALTDELWDERADSVVKQLHLKREMAEREQKHALALEEAVRVARLEGENAGFLKALEAQQRPIHVEVAHAAVGSPVAVVEAVAGSAAPLLPLPAAPMLSEVVNSFLAQYGKKDREPMLKKHKPTLLMLLEVVGDRPVDQIRQADINEFFEVITELPSNWPHQIKRHKFSIRELSAIEHPKKISPGTFKDTYLASVRPFIEAAQINYGDQGFPRTLTTAGIEYLGDVEADNNKQRAFKPHELQRLFGGKEMRKFASDPHLHCHYWLPTLGLFTGARVNELCQINPQVDILEEADTGIWYLWITDKTEADPDIKKSVKTKESRKVPLHKKLIELGFLNYVARLKVAGWKRLFPFWAPAPDSKASPAAEKWFVRLIEEMGLRDDTPKARLVGMHSFRHTFLSYGTASKPSLNLGVITGHAKAAFGVSAVQEGYNDKSITDKLEDIKSLLDSLDYCIEFFKPI